MKTDFKILRQLRFLAVLAFLAVAAPATRAAIQYPPGNFDVDIVFGCDCTCFCTSNGIAASNPIGAFLTVNPVVKLASSTKMPGAGQMVPPHWTLFPPAPFIPPYAVADCYPFYLEGWTITQSAIAAAGSVSPNPQPVVGFNFHTPINFQVPFRYYQDLLPMLSGSSPGENPVPSLQATRPQPYPWDVNTTLFLQNGQSYVMEQQLAVSYFPRECAPPKLQTPVRYDETNGLLRVTLICQDGNIINIANANITATLENVNIPPPLNKSIGGNVTDPLFDNWTWPLTINDLPTTGTVPGSAGTVQANLVLAGPTTINNLGLLVRADRAYTLTIAYSVPAIGPGITYMPTITVHTGLIAPCTNTTIIITTTNCYGIPNVDHPPPCAGDLIGKVDMLGPTTPGSLVNVRAYNGPAGNFAAQNVPVPPGSYHLTPVASDAFAPSPIPNTPYYMQATMNLSSFTDYEYFTSPILYPVDVLCGVPTDLTNVFFMCPTNPGVVRGTVTLNGPVGPGYWGGLPALSTLQFAVYDLNGLPHDPPPTAGFPPDPTLQNVNFAGQYLSFIKATGGASFGPPFLSTGGGSATTEFNNPGAFLATPNSYVGDYSLRMAGLMGQPSLWDVKDLNLVFGAPVNLAYTIHEMAPQFTNQLITCGTTLTRDINHCFGLYTAKIINLYPDLETYNYVTITVSGTGPGYTVGPFTINQFPFTYQTVLQNEAEIPLFLPEGNYEYTATVYNAYGSLVLGDTTYFSISCSSNPCAAAVFCPTNKTVDCGTQWTFNPPTFSTNCCGTNVTIDVLSTTTDGLCPQNFMRIWRVTDCHGYISTCTQTVSVVDSVPPLIVCNDFTVGCGTAWTFTTPFAYDFCCGSNVTVSALSTSTNGDCPKIFSRIWQAMDCCSNTITCTQRVTVVDLVAPVITGCSNIVVTLTNGQTSAVVNYVVTAADACSPPVTLTTTPPPGPFAAGVHLISCLAVDACGNSNTCSFTITVQGGSNCCDNCYPPYPASLTLLIQPDYNFLTIPLCPGTNSHLSVLFPSVPEGSAIIKWDNTIQDFDPTIATYFGGNWDQPGMTLMPGEVFAFYNSGFAFSNTWYGCLPTCPPPCAPTNGCQVVGALGLGTARWTNLYSCPPECGTTLAVWNTGTQDFGPLFTYLNDGWHPFEPSWGAGRAVRVCVEFNTNCVSCLACPTNLTVACGTPWTFTPPTIGTNCCGTNQPLTVVSTFTNGLCPQIATRIWQLVDCQTNISTCTQTVTLVDVTAPVIQCPPHMVFTSCSNLVVTYSVTATDNCCTNVTIFTTPASGSSFPVGTTLVNVMATDCCSNTSVCNFTVTIECPSNCCDNCTLPYPFCYTNFVPTGFSFLANNLCQGTNNTLNQVLAGAGEGTILSKWNPVTQGFEEVAIYDTLGGGWVDGFGFPSTATLSPGEGFVLNNPGSPYSLVICGCEPTCPPPCLPRPTGFALAGGYGMGPSTWSDLSRCPPQCGTEVLIWNGSTYDFYTYLNTGWTPPLPPIPAGKSVFVRWQYNPACESCTNELVINGSFELTSPTVSPNTSPSLSATTGVPGWTTTAGNTLEVWGNTVNGLPAAAGTNHMEINDSSTDQTVWQVVTNLSTNCLATFCFKYTGRFGLVSNTYNNDFTLTLSGGHTLTQDFDPAIYSVGGWTNYCMSFVPASSTIMIAFRGHPHYTNGFATAGGPHIDNVSLTQCCDTKPCITMDCAPNKTVTCSTNWSFDAPTNIEDRCCNSYSLTHTTVTNSGPCPRVLTRTWLVSDTCGNSNSCQQQVTVVNTNPPNVICASSKTVSCGTNWSFDVPSVLNACCGTNVTITVLATQTNGFCPQVATRIWQISDCCTNTTTCTQTVTIAVSGPKIAPVITAMHQDGAGMHIAIQSQPCYTYVLECRDSLSSGGWNICQTRVATGNILDFVDPSPLPLTRYYRVRLLCP